ncbi:hypothetical protein HK101_009459 [Irineochytrium annulatum]|nr:hypothetical protein HK101_009459 [Irineochytrium annulatum]
MLPSAIQILGLAPLFGLTKDPIDPCPRPRNHLKIVTFNVWFDGMLQRQRAAALLSQVAEELPDVVCFQEVTRTFMDVLTSTKWWTGRYHICGKALAFEQYWYGVVTLVRKGAEVEVVGEEMVEFPKSEMGRRLLVVTLRGKVNAEKKKRTDKKAGSSKDLTPHLPTIKVAMSHFESMPNYAAVRRQQFSFAADIAKVRDDSASHDVGIICGDMNLCNDDEDRALEDVGFRDCWRECHAEDTKEAKEAGFTFGRTWKKEFPGRIDRIGVHDGADEGGRGGPRAEVRVVECKLIGLKEMEGFEGAHPSDHLGVVATIEVTPVGDVKE